MKSWKFVTAFNFILLTFLPFITNSLPSIPIFNHITDIQIIDILPKNSNDIIQNNHHFLPLSNIPQIINLNVNQWNHYNIKLSYLTNDNSTQFHEFFKLTNLQLLSLFPNLPQLKINQFYQDNSSFILPDSFIEEEDFFDFQYSKKKFYTYEFKEFTNILGQTSLNERGIKSCQEITYKNDDLLKETLYRKEAIIPIKIKINPWEIPLVTAKFYKFANLYGTIISKDGKCLISKLFKSGVVFRLIEKSNIAVKINDIRKILNDDSKSMDREICSLCLEFLRMNDRELLEANTNVYPSTDHKKLSILQTCAHAFHFDCLNRCSWTEGTQCALCRKFIDVGKNFSTFAKHLNLNYLEPDKLFDVNELKQLCLL